MYSVFMSLTISDLHYLQGLVPDNCRRKLLSVLGELANLDAGADPGGGGRPRRAPPLKLEKIWFFCVKSWFFTRNTPTNFAPPSARRIFFKCAPLTWNPGSAPEMWYNMTNEWKKVVNFIMVFDTFDWGVCSMSLPLCTSWPCRQNVIFICDGNTHTDQQGFW